MQLSLLRAGKCLNGSHPCKTGEQGILISGVTARMDAVPVDYERNAVILIIPHHQDRELLGPSNKLSVYFQGQHIVTSLAVRYAEGDISGF
jgi:hypothetical protein